ncbi:hypothetical protein HHK36_008511 [Tetracentron sinense]|uniref:U1 small nuclear ribonucleoprotein 70 kDa n=1 Tax=Tetracentron sinense TaxID=13715 RepID=A0A834ZFK6_TETSI|nr:hypothetical protein HHK36_008511 [Tetracentron sinense]
MGDFNNDAFMRNRDAAVQARTKAQNRATVLQLKLIGQSHSTGLTSNLLKLFAPRPPLEYKPPPEKRKCPPYTGMAQFASNFAEPGDPEYNPPVQEAETAALRRARIHNLRLENGAKKAAEDLEKYDPNNDPNISGDPYKTLLVARLNYETTEHRIKREFEAYGPIKRVGIIDNPKWGSGYCLLTLVRMITDKVTNKPRGCAFVEYMHTRDMKAAYKQADGRKLDNRRVLVDVERGRTVPNWRPRRLGGGLGSTRVGSEEVNQKFSGREPQQSEGPPRSEEPRAREERHRDYERGDPDLDRGRSRGEREREREYDRVEPEHDHYEHHQDQGQYDDLEPQGDRDHYDHDDEHYNQMEPEGNQYDRGTSEPREREKTRDRGHEYQRSDRSLSRE